VKRLTTVSSADFIRNVGYWQNEALRGPISITHHGRERLILASKDDFESGQGSTLAPYLVIFDHMSEGVLIFDDQGGLARSNLAAQRIALRRTGANQITAMSDISPEIAASTFDAALFRARTSASLQILSYTSANRVPLQVTIIPVGGAAVVLLAEANQVAVNPKAGPAS
jgi:PAS domain-containing protein